MGSLAGWFSPAIEWENGIQSAKIKNKVREKSLIAQGRYTVICLGCVAIIVSKVTVKVCFLYNSIGDLGFCVKNEFASPSLKNECIKR